MVSSWLSLHPSYWLLGIAGTLNVLAFYWLFLAPRIYWRKRRVPRAKHVPLLGSVSDAALMIKPIGEVYCDLYNSRKDVRYLGIHKFSQPAFLLRDPEIIGKVLVKDFDHFPANDVHGDENLDPMFSRHLFALSGEHWCRLRSAVVTCFTPTRLREIFDLLPEVCGYLDKYLEEGLVNGGPFEVELRELCSNFSTSTISTCALGVPCDAISHPDVELRSMGRKLLEPSLKKSLSHLVFLQIPWLAKLLGIPFVSKEIREFFRNSTFREVSRREREGVTRRDFMQQLIQLWKEGKLSANCGDSKVIPKAITPGMEPKDLDDLTAVAMAFFGDGSVTTATLASFALFELSYDRRTQSLLRNEVLRAIRDNGGKLTFEALEQMTFLDMSLREVLRLYPPAPFMTRACKKRYRLPNPIGSADDGSGVWIEEGTPVIIPVYGIQRDPEYYPDPEVFDPKRFSEEEIKKRKSYTYYPAGEGPRVCVGLKFGFMQAKAAIATVLSKYELHPSSKSPKPITLDPHYFVTVAKGGLWVHIEKID